MDNMYSRQKSSKTQQSFRAYYPTDPNSLVSLFLKGTQDENRKLVSQSPVGNMILKAMTKYVIGQGLRPNSAPERTVLGWDDARANEFTAWAESYFRLMTDECFDYYGKNSFNRLQQIAFQNIMVSGDVLMHRLYANKRNGYRPLLQLISGTWIANPDNDMQDTKRCIAGVERDAYGRDIAYHIRQTDDYLNDTFTTRRYSRFNERTRFEEFTLINLITSEANQVRGIPLLQPVANDIVEMEVFDNAHLTKAMVNALLSTFITKEKDSAPATVPFYEKTEELAIKHAEDMGDPVMVDSGSITLGSGNLRQLEEGEKVETSESKLAGADYSAYMKTKLDLICSGAGCPREATLGQYESSFSAARGTIGSAEKGFAPMRDDFARKFCTPIWRMVIDYGLRTGRFDCPEYFESEEKRRAVLAVTWIGPRPTSINPTAEVKAYIDAIDAHLIDRSKACMELFGLDVDEVLSKQAVENERISQMMPSQMDAPTQEEDDETEE